MELERKARALYEEGDVAGGDAAIADAVVQLQRAEVFYDGYTASSIVIATLLQSLGETARADSILSGFLDHALDNPESREADYLAELFFRRANLRFDTGDFVAAYEDYASLTQILPHEWQAWEGQVRALAAQGQRQRAIQVLDTWLSTYSTHQPAKDMRARLAGSGGTPAPDDEGAGEEQ
jgi:tetratricopeptide (TPR) repeat protein